MLRAASPGALGAMALGRDQSYFKQIFESSPDPTWIIDGNHFVECNEAAVQTLGYPSRDEFLNVHPSKLSPPRQADGEDSYVKAERMMAVAKGKGLHRFEWIHTKANGTDFVAEVTLSTIQLADRQVIYCVWRDITERKQVQQALLEATQQWQTTFNATQDAICLLDRDQKILRSNPAMAALTGVSVEDMSGKHCWEVVHGTTEPIPQCPLMRARTSLSREQMELQTGNRWLTITVDPVLGDAQEFQGAVHIIRDITERKSTEQKLLQYQSRMSAVMENFPGAVSVMDSDLRLTGYNSQFKKLLELPDSLFEKPDVSLVDFIRYNAQRGEYGPGDIEQQVAASIERARKFQPHKFERVRPNGRVLEVRGEPIPNGGFVTVYLDITERKKLEEQVRELAFYDPLTQLPNRRLLEDRLSQALAESKRSGHYGGLMFLDLDNFKTLNDKHGHAVGDLLLVQAARRMKSCVREVDTVARHGGDEFVVVMGDLNEDKAASTAQASSVAEKIRSALAEPYHLTVKHEGHADAVIEHQCTASIGVVVFIDREGTQDDFLRLADTAMYQAKNAGSNLIRFFEVGG